MADGSRIPQAIAPFNTYIISTDGRLQAISSGIIHNWERLGLTSVNATDWHDKKVYWTDTLYPKYQDPLQSTSAVKTEVKNFMDSFKTFGQPLLNIMAASPNANSDDEAVFNFKIGRAAPSHVTSPITDAVVYDAKPLGGGEFEFNCRTAHDTHRASLAGGADSVQLAHMLVDNSNPPAGTPGGDTPPTPEDAGMTRDIITKAQFVFHAGAANVGRSMVMFARWYNTKHPELAGPWTAVRLLVIA